MNIVADNGYVTEILEPGPHISDTQLKEFMQKFASLAEESGLVILSGSAAPGIPQIFMPGFSGALLLWENR